MAEITGAMLKKAREARNIPLEQVANATHIRLELLRDLEDEEYDSIASSAQRKGFIHIYSNYLQLSEAEIHELSDPEPEATPSNEETPAFAPELPEKRERVLSKKDTQISKAEPKPDAPAFSKPPASEPAKQDKEETQKPAAKSRKFLRIGKTKNEILETPKAPNPSEEKQKEIGHALTDRRRYLNLPWELITEQIHIPKDQLQALERGEISYFSNTMQAKGVLQNYAKFLNLDTDALLVKFAESLQLHRLEQSKKPAKSSIKELKVLSPIAIFLKKFFTLDLFFGTFLIVGMLGFLVWGMARMATIQKSAPPRTPLPDLSQVLQEMPTQETVTAEAPEIAFSETPVAELSPEVTATPLFTPVISEDPVQLVIIPRSQEWLRISKDGEIVFTGRLPVGQAVQYTAQEGILLETGNAAGFQIIFNGKEIPHMGPIGTIARVNFSTTGINYLTGQAAPTQEPLSNPTSTEMDSAMTPTLEPTEAN